MSNTEFTTKSTGILYLNDKGHDKVEKIKEFLKSEGVTLSAESNTMGPDYLVISFDAGASWVSLDETLGCEVSDEN